MRHRQRRRGFTLTEIVLVLAMVGLIIGAVFAAASVVHYRVNLNQASDELNMIASNIRSLYAGQDVSFANLNSNPSGNNRPLNAPPSASDFTFYTPIFVQQGAFPIEMLSPRPAAGRNPCLGAAASNPWKPVVGTCGGSTLGSAQAAL